MCPETYPLYDNWMFIYNGCIFDKSKTLFLTCHVMLTMVHMTLEGMSNDMCCTENCTQIISDCEFK